MEDENLPPTDLTAAIIPITKCYCQADNPLIRGVNRLAESVTSNKLADLIPDTVKLSVSDAIEASLWHIYDAAELTQSRDDSAKKQIMGWELPEVLRVSKQKKFNQIAAAVAGAIGGAGGLATTIVELPVTIGLIFREIQLVSKKYDKDPASDEGKWECLSVFLTGTSLEHDDTVGIGFIDKKVVLHGAAIKKLIDSVAPQLLKVLGPKLVSPPVIGAVTGGGLNLIYMDYYRRLAHVNFQLAGLSPRFDKADVQAEFKRQVVNKHSKATPIGVQK